MNAPLEQPRYGNSTMFDRQTANFCAEGWNTLTWQVYEAARRGRRLSRLA